MFCLRNLRLGNSCYPLGPTRDDTLERLSSSRVAQQLWGPCMRWFSAKSVGLENLTARHHSHGIIESYFKLSADRLLSQNKTLLWSVAALYNNLVAWAEVSYNYFDAPKIQIIMSSVNPIFLKPNSCNCASHRFRTIQDGAIMSWLQSGHYAVNFSF